MSYRLQSRTRALFVGAAPLVLLAGASVHPYLGNMPDSGDIAEAVAADPTRWGIAHVVIGVGIALSLVLFFAVRIHLHDRGEDRWSFWGTPLVAVGLGLIGFMVGAEGIGGRAAAVTPDVRAFFEEMEPWAVPVYLTANVLLGVGVLAFAKGVASSGTLGRRQTWVVAAGAVLAVAGLFLPTGWAAHLVSLGMIAFAWPLAAHLWSATRHDRTSS